MDRLRVTVDRFSVPMFFILAYGFSWAGWLYANRVLDVYRDVLEGAESILLVSEIPLAVRITVLPAFITPTFGPAISAILLTAIIDGKAGLREFFGRIIKWQVDFRFYLLITLLPLVLHLLPFGIAYLLGSELPGFAPISFIAALGIFIDRFFRSGGQEELGFRGFAQHRLREKIGPFSTSLIIGVLWFFWHLPLYLWIPETSQFGRSLVTGVLTQVSITFLFTWVYDHTQSILLPMLLHASINLFGTILSAGIPHPSGSLIFETTWTVSYLLIGTLLILRYGSGDKTTLSSNRDDRSHSF